MIHIPNKKKWSELTNVQKAGIIMMTVVQIGLLVAALVDLRRRAPEEINGSKRWWVAAAFVNYVGPIAYFVFGRKR